MYVRPPHVAYAASGDGVVVLDMESGEHVGLPAHAGRIWDLVLAHGEPEAVVAALAAEYPDADPAVIAADVAALLDRLVDGGLLHRVEH